MEKDFLNYKNDEGAQTNDLLFGLLYWLATYHPEENVFYLPIKKYNANKAAIMDICAIGSDKTLKRQVDALVCSGLLKAQLIELNGEDTPVYTFPYDVDTNFQYVNYDMLFWIITTRNRNALRIYTYLLNKYLWKKGEGGYNFTISELAEALGYSTKPCLNALVSATIGNILDSFQKEGIIHFTRYTATYEDKSGVSRQAPKMNLQFVAQKKSEF